MSDEPTAASPLRQGTGDPAQSPSVATPAPRRREGQWQPIETAPQEAKQILVYLKGTAGLGIYRAYWNAAIGEWLASSYDHCDMFPPGSTLTHWMPLPDPPCIAQRALDEAQK